MKMAVLHDYFCSEHGIFEAWEAKCPMKICKGEISKVFLQPVGIKSERTKNTDKTVNQLAMDFQMTDIKSTREGDNQSGFFTRNNTTSPAELAKQEAEAKREPRMGDAAIWGGKGGLNMQSVIQGNMFRSVAGESVGVNPKDAGNLTGPRTASYIADQDNLTLPK